MIKMANNDTATLQVDKETHTLIKQYCVLNDIKVKDLIRDWANEKLKNYKHKVEELKNF
jgi:hypothetical protein